MIGEKSYNRLRRKHRILSELPTADAQIAPSTECYLGLNLCLLAHNVELQARVIETLLDPGNVQGGYYKLIVANILIRSGRRRFDRRVSVARRRASRSSVVPLLDPARH